VRETWDRRPLERVTGEAALARAEALLGSAADGPALAWSVVDPPALILGRSAGEPGVDEAACRAAGVAVLRRASGGGPVLWDAGLLALDVALPRGHRLAGDDVVAAYEWLGSVVADGLRRLGVAARVVGIDEARSSPRHRLAGRACFGGFSPFEVVVGERKVVGLAQVRRRSGVLFQAGIALRLDASGLGALLDLGPDREAFAAALRAQAAGLDEVGPHPGAGEVIAAVEAALGAREAIALHGGPEHAPTLASAP